MRGVISDLGRQMQRIEDDLGSFVFLYNSIFFRIVSRGFEELNLVSIDIS